MDIFLEYVGLTESEFNQIINTMAIPPHKPNFDTNEIAEKTWDFEQWYREDNRNK